MSRISRGDGYSVYGMFDPRDPTHTIRYFGSTRQDPRKRVCDHEAEVRFYSNPKNCKKYARSIRGPAWLKQSWLKPILDAGLKVGFVTVATGLDKETARALETSLLKTVPDIVNWEQTPIKYKQTKDREQANTREARQALGYPHPDLPCKHTKNYAHYKKLIGKKIAEAHEQARAAATQALLPQILKIAGGDHVTFSDGKTNWDQTLKKHGVPDRLWQYWKKKQVVTS